MCGAVILYSAIYNTIRM